MDQSWDTKIGLYRSKVLSTIWLGDDEAFSLVAKITIVQVPLVLVANKEGIMIDDMKNVFLHGELDYLH